VKPGRRVLCIAFELLVGGERTSIARAGARARLSGSCRHVLNDQHRGCVGLIVSTANDLQRAAFLDHVAIRGVHDATASAIDRASVAVCVAAGAATLAGRSPAGTLARVGGGKSGSAAETGPNLLPLDPMLRPTEVARRLVGVVVSDANHPERSTPH
jgi:hypothetical protein